MFNFILLSPTCCSVLSPHCFQARWRFERMKLLKIVHRASKHQQVLGCQEALPNCNCILHQQRSFWNSRRRARQCHRVQMGCSHAAGCQMMQPSMHWCRCALPQTHRLWVRMSTVCPRPSCTVVQGSSKKRSSPLALWARLAVASGILLPRRASRLCQLDLVLCK